MSFITPTKPNITDFWTFLNTSVQIPTAALPTDSDWPGYALNQAIDLVLCPPGGPGILYVLATYNCATHILFSITPDQAGQTYFADARSANGYGLTSPSSGLISASADQATSQSIMNPDFVKGLTIGDLDFYRTPWGRDYLAWNQAYGPGVWVLV